MPLEEPWRVLVGKKCWHVSAGGVTSPSFTLALGEKIPRATPLRNETQPEIFRHHDGSVELLVWCTWRLQTEDRVLASSDQQTSGVAILKTLIDATVVAVNFWPPASDLRLDFSDGRTLMVFCDHVEPEASFSQNWELWVPGWEVTAGPGSALLIEPTTHVA